MGSLSCVTVTKFVPRTYFFSLQGTLERFWQKKTPDRLIANLNANSKPFERER